MTPLPIQKIPQTTKYCKLMMSQLILLQTFVEDLLDLKQMRDGVFSLVSVPFNVEQVIKDICSVFDPQAKAKGVRVACKVL